MKKVISIKNDFQDAGYKRAVLTVVRDPEKMPVVVINKKEKNQEPVKNESGYCMPEIPDGYIKCRKHDCL